MSKGFFTKKGVLKGHRAMSKSDAKQISSDSSRLLEFLDILFECDRRLIKNLSTKGRVKNTFDKDKSIAV